MYIDIKWGFKKFKVLIISFIPLPYAGITQFKFNGISISYLSQNGTPRVQIKQFEMKL